MSLRFSARYAPTSNPAYVPAFAQSVSQVLVTTCCSGGSLAKALADCMVIRIGAAQLMDVGARLPWSTPYAFKLAPIVSHANGRFKRHMHNPVE